MFVMDKSGAEPRITYSFNLFIAVNKYVASSDF